MNYETQEYLVKRLWQNKLSNLVSAIRFMRKSFADRNVEDELIDRREVAQGALRDLRVIQLDIVTSDIRWHRYNLRSPFIVAKELTEKKEK